MQKTKRVYGACLMKQSEKNFNPKRCKNCGSWFKLKLPYQKYCCKECSDQGYKNVRKEYDKIHVKKSTRYTTCEICGKSTGSHYAKFCLECCVKKSFSDDMNDRKRYKKILECRGYIMEEIKEMYCKLERGEEIV